MMMCEQPIMDQEARLFDTLRNTRRFEIASDGRLSLFVQRMDGRSSPAANADTKCRIGWQELAN